jgi:alkanesulfonate monooxygenase SsuD/methylene tetrahydromethanopterin reductase-like flavin-dependent oxidoreductase (luciferase family)
MARIGLALLPHRMGWERWKRLLQLAEDSGFQCVFATDHYPDIRQHPNPEEGDSLDTWTALTYAADHTKRLDLGSIVSPVTFRHPTMLARMAAAVNALSGGRLTLGLGAGWLEWEHTTFGLPFYDAATRFEMLEDALAVTARLFHSDQPVSYAGRHFSLQEAMLLPRLTRVPMMVGGSGPKRTLPLVAQYADEWNAVGLSVEGYRERAALLDSLLSERGRKPAAVKRSMFMQTLLALDDADFQTKLGDLSQQFGQALTEDQLADYGMVYGEPGQWVEQLSRYAEAGVERFMLRWPDPDDLDGLERIARDVLPHFHR